MTGNMLENHGTVSGTYYRMSMTITTASRSRAEDPAMGVQPAGSTFRRIGAGCRLLAALLCLAFFLMPFTSARGNPLVLYPPMDEDSAGNQNLEAAANSKFLMDLINLKPPEAPSDLKTPRDLVNSIAKMERVIRQASMSSGRWASMSTEDVTISVGLTQSTVTGRYAFQKQPMKLNGPIMVYIPVLLQDGSADDYEKAAGTPVVSLKNRKLRTHRIFPGPVSAPVSLPGGWAISWYGVSVPHDASAEFSFEVSYMQPAFADGRVGYVPYSPPKKDQVRGQIAFRAADGVVLRRSGAFSFLSRASRELTFTPRHHKLISVKVREVR